MAHSAGVGLFGAPRERLGAYLPDWLRRRTPRLAPGTVARYKTFIAQIRQDALGAIPLARLSPRALEAYYSRRLDAGLSPTTVNHHHRMLHVALADAVRQDLILQNPAGAAEAPKRTRFHPAVWTEAQTLLFLSEAKARSQYYGLYLFIVGTGVRVGEALGLAWSRLDLREGLAHIEQALHRSPGGGYRFGDPKSLRPRRAIALSPELVVVLRELELRRGEERARRDLCERGGACAHQACVGWHETGLVFTQPNGKPLHANNIRERDLRRLCRPLGLPARRALHNLRHAHGSYLLQRGVSLKTIQQRLGHASAQFTLSTYLHVLDG